ncbi:MAG TPA: hypothetical protein PLU80_10870 [Acidobacteriota bacterium]|nr:hypothetical protein [Acidobacteriota bacterium]HNC44660.1 hypothetical protein [Acidobacteriota bacterium]
MRTCLIRLFLFCGAMILASIPTLAQDTPKAELFAGYSAARFANRGDYLSGFSVSINGNFTRSVGVVADFGTYFKNNDQIYNFMAGPRFSYRKSSRVTPFAQVLAGVVAPEPAFTMAIGGGIDIKLNEHIAFRAVQVEYLFLRGGENATNHNARISTGIVFRFGKI